MSAGAATGMGVAAVIAAVEAAAPPRHQASWDKSGVQVAGRRARVSRLAVTLDPRPDVLDAALAWGADFVLCHHPLTLAPRLPDRLDGYHAALRSLLTADAWLYAAHTSLDCQHQGPPAWLARELGMSELRVVEPLVETPTGTLGFGIIGRLPRAMPSQEFVAELRRLLGRDFLLTAGNAPEAVDTVAYCPGSGGSMAEQAFDLGAQVFVTGEVKHHQAVDAAAFTPVGAPPDAGIPAGRLLVDAGHFVLEEKMMQAFHALLAPQLRAGGVEAAFFPTAEPLRLWRGSAGQQPLSARG